MTIILLKIMNNLNNESTSLQVQVEDFKRTLKQNPKRAYLLAVTYFTRYLKISSEYQKLQNEPKLFPVPDQHQIHEAHNSLLLDHGQLHLENNRLRKRIERLEQDHQDLMQVVEAIIDENAPLPDRIEKVLEL